jgi:O-antigen ligase
VAVTAVSIPAPQASAARARGAYLAFLVFIFAVYSNIGILVPPLAKLAPGKLPIAVSAAALVWSCLLGGRRFRLGWQAGGAALFLFFALVMASPLWSVAPDMSWDAAAEGVKYLAAFIIAANVLDTRQRIRHAAAALALATLFPALGVIQSYLTGTNLIDGRPSWVGNFGNPNFLAYHLVMATPIALALREASRGTLRRLAWLGVVAVYAGGVLLTQSRGGALALAAVVGWWLLRSLARGRAAVGAALAVVAALLLSPISPLNREDTRANLSGAVDMSAQGRIDAWRSALRIAEDRPLGGVGAGAFVVGYDLYAPGDAGPARAAHNSFAMVAAEVGIPALLVFVIAILAAMLTLGRVARVAPRGSATVARGAQAALLGFIVCSMTGSYAFSWPLYFVLGMSAAMARRELAS